MLFKKNLLGLTIAFILSALTVSCQPSSFKIPDLIKAGDPGFVGSELIYSLEHKPTTQCHASTMVELSDGLMAAWFGGTHERNSDVGIWVAMNKNGRWSHPVQVANGFENDSVRYPCWNPVLFKPSKGPLMLFYKVGPSPSDWWGMLMTSDDDGKTWSDGKRLGKHAAIDDLLGPVKNKPIELADGTMICPSSREVEINDKDQWRLHLEVTKDFGKTWEVIGPLNDGIEFNAIQPSILTHPDNKMQLLCRTQEGSVGQSWSTDNGKTWSKLKASPLPNPNAGTDAVTLQDGRQLIVYNHTRQKGEFPRGRNMLNVATSRDGVEWKVILTLERSEGEYSYPAVIQTRDGMVHISYTYLRKSIKHVIIDPSKLK
ncbi:MAG: exo-alpha-sialidase [Cyclobacteriaceae bacterium]|nr:exo-alpha-sialidase [Cyclobacteriaceae bacterium]